MVIDTGSTETELPNNSDTQSSKDQESRSILREDEPYLPNDDSLTGICSTNSWCPVVALVFDCEAYYTVLVSSHAGIDSTLLTSRKVFSETEDWKHDVPGKGGPEIGPLTAQGIGVEIRLESSKLRLESSKLRLESSKLRLQSGLIKGAQGCSELAQACTATAQAADSSLTLHPCVTHV